MEENILLPFPSDYDEKLKVSSLDPNTEVEVIDAREVQYSCSLVDYIYRLPRVLLENETPQGVGAILFSNSARKKIEHSLSIYTQESDRVAYARVLPYIVDVVRGSILIEEHRDRKKDSNKKRQPENGSDPNILKVQRLYGAISIDGILYRAKTTVQVFKVGDGQSRYHGYEVTKIELLNQTGSLDKSLEVHQSLNSNSIEELLNPKTATPTGGRLQPLNSNSISLAKLLKGVELSYEPNVKLLDAMQACHQFAFTGDYAELVKVYETARNKRLSTTLSDPLQAVKQAQAEMVALTKQTTQVVVPSSPVQEKAQAILAGRSERNDNTFNNAQEEQEERKSQSHKL